MVPTQMNANALLNANYLYSIYRILLFPGIPLAFPDIPVGIDRKRTSELAYPATVVLNSFSPRRERLGMPAKPGEIENERTSGLAYPVTVVLNSFSPGRERLAMPAMSGELENERTSEFAYPATMVLNAFSPRREVSYA